MSLAKYRIKHMVLAPEEIPIALRGKLTILSRAIRHQPERLSSKGVRYRMRMRDGSPLTCHDLGQDKHLTAIAVEMCCPYSINQIVWIQEALYYDKDGWRYTADNALVQVRSTDNPYLTAMLAWAHHNDREKCQPQHMPRFASRLSLKITDIKIHKTLDNVWQWIYTVENAPAQ